MSDNLPNATDDTTDTGYGTGSSPTGLSVGGSLEGPSTEGIGGSKDTDTGLDFGPGQSTTTGPQGTGSLDGPVELDTSVGADDPRNEDKHHLTPKVTNGDLGD